MGILQSVKITNRKFTVPNCREKRLPSGVCQFTLYDATGRERSERLVFNLPDSTYNIKKSTAAISVKTNKESYKPYESIALELSADTLFTKSGNSVSVADRDAATSNFGNSDNSNIFTNFLLSSDLKGTIKKSVLVFSKKGLGAFGRTGFTDVDARLEALQLYFDGKLGPFSSERSH